jgi:glycosyltransferase involved in cell wall biosynthesis
LTTGKLKVLFLTPWYPSERDAMAGLFVQKHAHAVRAQGCDVRVIHAQTWAATWKQWKALRREGWMPDIVQLNVLQKQGVLAPWLKKRYHIPYIIVEHWSGYLPENGMFMHFPAPKRRLYRRICSEAEHVLTVSLHLQQAMRDCGLEAKQWGTIDNVVDDFFFGSLPRPLPEGKGHKTLLHVSCFDERAKNVTALLRAVKMLAEKRQDWKLVMVGTGIDYNNVRAYAKSLDIPGELLEWCGELTPQGVADEMHRADALVLSSRYETYGVVLAEAAAAGLPVLSTPVGIARETGALIVSQEIAQNKPGKFAEFMESILWKPTPNPSLKGGESVSHNTDRFTAQTIGKKLMDIYDSSLHRDI